MTCVGPRRPTPSLASSQYEGENCTQQLVTRTGRNIKITVSKKMYYGVMGDKKSVVRAWQQHPGVRTDLIDFETYLRVEISVKREMSHTTQPSDASTNQDTRSTAVTCPKKRFTRSGGENEFGFLGVMRGVCAGS